MLVLAFVLSCYYFALSCGLIWVGIFSQHEAGSLSHPHPSVERKQMKKGEIRPSKVVPELDRKEKLSGKVLPLPLLSCSFCCVHTHLPD